MEEKISRKFQQLGPQKDQRPLLDSLVKVVSKHYFRFFRDKVRKKGKKTRKGKLSKEQGSQNNLATKEEVRPFKFSARPGVRAQKLRMSGPLGGEIIYKKRLSRIELHRNWKKSKVSVKRNVPEKVWKFQIDKKLTDEINGSLSTESGARDDAKLELKYLKGF